MSLWHVVGNEDFDIDFDIPFVVFTDEASLMVIDGIEDMADVFDEEGLLNLEEKTLTEEGKDLFRDWYSAYMYIDNDFFEAIKDVCKKELKDVKTPNERPEVFVEFKDGSFTFLDHFDFSMDGRTLLGYDSVFRRLKHHYFPVWRFANLDHVEETSLQSLFR